jgi:uncharacterized membrane protein
LNSENRTKLPLLPYQYRFWGLVIALCSLPFFYLYFWGGRPEFFNIKVFAIATTYLENRFFVAAQTNILDEIACILVTVGLTLISLSRKKNESDQDIYKRLKALLNAVVISAVLIIISTLFFFGWSFFIVLSLSYALFLIIYNCLFWWQK